MTEIEETLEPSPALAEPGEPDDATEETSRTAQLSPGELSPDQPIVADLASLDDQRRSDWATRIRAERRLPGSLRDCLAAAVQEAAELNGTAEPRLTVTQVANVFAEALPALLSLESGPALASHPAGEAFFRGGQLSDDDAARIASEQLARTGFGRNV